MPAPLRAAQMLEGAELDDGWQVGAPLPRKPDATGGTFSVAYPVKRTNSRGIEEHAFLKALGKLLSKSAASQQVADLSKGLPGAPTQIGYGLGVDIAGDWVLQNPVFNGYAGIAAYLPSQQISIVIDNTYGPNADESTSIASEIFKALATYLAPNDPI